jgi:Domain of unknown function (DUF3303)
MKYVLSWTNRLGGSSKENEESAKRALELFSKWQPPAGVTFHQFVGRLDGEGAFAVVETDNPNDILDASAKFAPLKLFNVYPVVDMTEWAQKLQEGVEFRESIG